MKLFRTLAWALLLPALLLFTSCFDIVEQYHFKKNGSGSGTIMVDMSRMMGMLQSLGGDSATQAMDEAFGDKNMLSSFEGVPGISNVKDISDRKTGIVGATFDFENISALNALMKSRENSGDNSLAAIMNASKTENKEAKDQFTFNGKSFSRNLSSFDALEMSEEELSSMQMFMGEASYKVIYTFDDQAVKKTTIGEATISSDRHTVTAERSLLDIIKKEKGSSLSGKISVK